jgi:XXXCH domain-containing protein
MSITAKGDDMADKDLKIDGTFSEKELKALFDELASLLAGASKGKLADLRRTLATSSKTRIGLKRKGDGVEMKVKVKTEATPAKKPAKRAPAAAAKTRKPKYKALKKRMEQSFKSISKSLKAGNLPAKQTVQAFLKDSDLMITYPKKGDKHYNAYKKACQSFQTAFEEGKLPSVRRTYKRLDTLMDTCHDEYK